MNFRSSLKLALLDKVVFGLIVVVATGFGNFITDKRKIASEESLKSVDYIVQSYEDYAIALDNYEHKLEELQREKQLLEMMNLFEQVETESFREAEEKIDKLELDKINDLKILNNLIRSSDIIVGAQLQGHLSNRLSYLIFLYSAKDNLRQARKDENEWLIDNSMTVIENAEHVLKSTRLSISQVRGFAIDQAML